MRARLAFIRVACLGAALAFATAAVAQTPVKGARIALVIGNGDYLHAPLRNARADARAMAQALRATDFEVALVENARREELLDALKEFIGRSRNAQTRLVYFAGHGAQLRGQNYILPVDAVLKDEEELATRAANVTDVMDRLGRLKNGVNLVILDACRNVPIVLAVRTRDGRGTRDYGAGFARVDAPAGTLVAYSTAPGAVAYDGSDGNSPYTRHLVANMQIAGMPVEQLFKRVRIAVRDETREAQTPWETSNLTGEFCFRAGPAGECGFAPDTRGRGRP